MFFTASPSRSYSMLLSQQKQTFGIFRVTLSAFAFRLSKKWVAT